MLQQIVLMKDVTEDHLKHLHSKGLVRAAIPVEEGIVAGFAMVAGEQMSTRSEICPPGTICDPYYLEEILFSRLSMAPARLANYFVLLEVEHGRRREWAEVVRAVADKHSEGDVYIAAAHAFGRGRYNAVVEVLGDDFGRAHEVLLELTDVDGVKGAHLLRVHGERALGMGSAPSAG